MSPSAYIGFGSNLGDRKTKFQEALRALENLPNTRLKARSRLYETNPIGLSDDGPKFLNAVILVETDLSPRELIGSMRSIELALGKSVCHQSDKSRVIDLDLLLYGEDYFREDDLEIPHPRMSDRAFVLAPLAELAPNILIPGLERTVEDLIRLLPEGELAGVRHLDFEHE
jgi:2-amino-4-hydroxy-6-hydroxymethyldihydropteridine diphosphokinase